MSQTREDDVRRAFLSERDVACPKCGYNLRGGAGDECPECGLKIVLEVAGRKAWSAPAVFAFVAFGWGLTAGVMNSVRNVRGLYEQAVGPAFSVGGFAGNGFVRGGTIIVQGPGSAAYPISTGGFSWSALWSLPLSDWIDPVWSVVCAGLAIAGLALVWRAVRSPAPSWRAARLVLLALYGIYGGYHVIMFVRQMTYW